VGILLKSEPIDGEALVGPATHFLSHAYQLDFLFSVDAAEEWALRNPHSGPHFFYFDLLVLNQHAQPPVIAPEVLWREFVGGVQSVGHTLLVLDFERMLPLTRAWCLAEIVAGMGIEGTFEVIMPPAEKSRFLAALQGQFDSIAIMTCCVDLEKATAWHGAECLVDGACRDVPDRVTVCPNHVSFIRAAVANSMGFFKANTCIIGHLREWMEASARRALNELALERAASPLMRSLANLLRNSGKLRDAELLYLEALEGRSRTEPDLATLSVLHDFAHLREAQGLLNVAEELFRESRDGRLRALSSSHRDTLASTGDLARLLMKQDRLEEAEPLLLEAFNSRRQPLFLSHCDTLASTSNLGCLRMRQGRLTDAEPLLIEAYEGRRDGLGEFHPVTLVSASDLATLRTKQEKYSEAELLLIVVLSGRWRTLGDAHSSTVDSICSLASLLEAQGRRDMALPLYQQALLRFPK
jgi:tetratricopeptide (TPR) repeat protein